MSHFIRLRFSTAIALLIVGMVAATRAESPSDDVRLKVATPDEVDAVIGDYKGKIVVVDIWATWCIPCKKEFPHLVELHKKHAGDGVACMSIAMDIEKQHENALKFLKEKGAEFANFRMDRDEEATDKWQERYKMQAIPVVLVFGRDGKLAKKFEGDSEHKFSYDDVNKLVDELLKK